MNESDGYTLNKDASDTSYIQHLLNSCLYFTSSTLFRIITRMAEEEFGVVGLSPSHSFLLLVANEHPGISQKQAAHILNLSPSTVSRFVDTLVSREFMEKREQGRLVLLFPTKRGGILCADIRRAWASLYKRYTDILGVEIGNDLTRMIDGANKKLTGGI
ncbi:MAG: MarR family transcriptional regulator [Deltaproteobacteria bacterium]|nr:MarR family transcriptional regulator [Candidatus Zymogenaceae bacterium]